MKRCLLILLVFVTSLVSGCQQQSEPEKFVLAYVTSGATSVPDTKYITHLNYAFGTVNETFDGIVIQNEERLHQLAALKKQAPQLKILLSIGGWGAGRFSEMAADEQKRRTFAANCRQIMDEFKIDGVDIDWEYPTVDWAGISASPEDTDNYTLLMRDIRKAIGEDGLLTLASVANAKYVDFKAILPYIDFVNIMAYDMNRPPYHHAALYRSEMTKNGSADEAVQAHLAQGIPADKLLLGVPFYGRARKPLPDAVNYKDIIQLEGYTTCWDSLACCPYLKDKDGKMACSYDSPQSITIKCEYIKEKGLKGIMYWQYDGDDENGSLRKAAFEGL